MRDIAVVGRLVRRLGEVGGGDEYRPGSMMLATRAITATDDRVQYSSGCWDPS
ncbi:hypothetical protein [Streptomyces sp. V4I2]|uniref:hypothetical protein n=1 Tax=Streptomyces sp. V4I2 TaxID=3042280 RepID=UPI00277E01AB|nr:hypothetical protein [Streptomyces sp. V4I2]MDQ1048492.1 hypothetical protein [Streptomyces sp. V4I2]